LESNELTSPNNDLIGADN
jgi:hypothetical protein